MVLDPMESSELTSWLELPTVVSSLPNVQVAPEKKPGQGGQAWRGFSTALRKPQGPGWQQL